jgi:hypothetical protein
VCADLLVCGFYFKHTQFMLNFIFYVCEMDLGLNSFTLYDIYVGRFLLFQEYWFNLCGQTSCVTQTLV